MKILAACLVSLALLPACTASRAGDYLQNRGGDLVDCLRFHVMAGKGASVKLEVTRGLHLGIGGESEVWAWGLANREVSYWRESIFTWGVIVGRHDELEIQGIDGRLSGSYGWVFNDQGTSFEFAEPNNPLDFLTVRGTAMVLLGADVELRFGEVIDFVVGIFQFDPANDDKPYSEMKRLPDEEEPVDAETQS